ncbi:hypothetical protein JCM14244_00980 [Venenivibrio stagnispumantis]|uniref:Membrane-bound lytic murein transglycosylase D n=1 Tax=Venenivibrio stagnispumantis TaxID=407998 RepID=A0AA45WK79_9AQUI|nr:lytic transglycosylase domain-containing protein [Venenivibrio stagnispumantis]MCW4573515.1 lytic transglycosylase domain-containing protein [Venenivibrio stagnispumantis]SMP06225.1 membrane-bound lytic murein transglycosylase D [Venenivibrio stagnispumantis]
MIRIKLLIITLILITTQIFAKDFIEEKEINTKVEEKISSLKELKELESFLNEVEFKDKELKKWQEYYNTRGKKEVEISLERGKSYIPFIKAIFEKEGIPQEFMFLPIVESKFIMQAKSPKGAAGIWQFMPQTARNYGLVVNKYIDERLDPIKSTIAAAKHLKSLYRIFSDWVLVIASYNSGENKIIRKVSLHGSSYTDIKNYLPSQTKSYVPSFIALIEVAKELAEKKGYLYKDTDIEVVKVDRGLNLKEVAKKLDISFEKIKSLNPHILKGVIPDDNRVYNLYLPKGYTTDFLTKVMVD